MPGWDNAEAQTLMEQILVDADNDVDAVFAANDGLGNSAINALEAAGIEARSRERPGRDRGRHPEHRPRHGRR